MSSNPYKELAQQLIKKANQFNTATKGIIKGINRIMPQKIANDYQGIANQVILEFYQSYHPDYYDRTNSLYKAFKIKYGKGWVDWKLTSGGLEGHRASQELIFDYMINKGLHGGAPDNNGIYKYRTPYNHYNYWGREAIIAPFSPSEEIKQRIAQRKEIGWQEDERKIVLQAIKGVI